MKETDTLIDGREILARLSANDVPSTWRVFPISRKKLAVLIFFFCIFMSLWMGFLAIYLFGNFDYHPPIPPTTVPLIFTIMLVFIGASFLLSLVIWTTMKNKVLVLTSLGLVRGDWKKPKRILCIAYQDIAEMSLDASSVLVQRKGETWRKKQLDCRLFEASPQEVALSLLAAYEGFRAKHSHRGPKKH